MSQALKRNKKYYNITQCYNITQMLLKIDVLFMHTACTTTFFHLCPTLLCCDAWWTFFASYLIRVKRMATRFGIKKLSTFFFSNLCTRHEICLNFNYSIWLLRTHHRRANTRADFSLRLYVRGHVLVDSSLCEFQPRLLAPADDDVNPWTNVQLFSLFAGWSVR